MFAWHERLENWWREKREPVFLYTRPCCDICREFKPRGPLAWCDFCHKETTFHSENVYKDPWPWNTMWSVNVSDDVRRRALRAAGAVCPH